MPSVSFEDVESAHRRIANAVIRTPVLRFDRLDQATNASVFIKPEQFQGIGSFKIRGALNKVRRLLESSTRPAGLLTASSGNHAQAVAAVSNQIDVPAIILMPSDAAENKIARTRALGADVRLFDRFSEDRRSLLDRLLRETQYLLVPPADDPDIIAGQGTAAKELFEDVQGSGISLDYLLICCGAGGLSAGSAISARSLSPATKVIIVEPEEFDDFARSLSQGHRVPNKSTAKTICDSLKATTPGRLPFDILSRAECGCLTVSDSEVFTAMKYALLQLKLVVEPGGAVALAALLAGKIDTSGKRIGIMISGGNIEREIHKRCLDDVA